MYLLAVKNEAQVTESLFFSMPFPPSDILDNLLYKIIKIGFIFLTLSIITRTIYMTRIWGEPFDLYYVWPYAMWILYAILIMYRSTRGQNANAAAWGSIACFFVSMHSFIGYNDFLRGL
jgi:ABC-type uncharacterized transport system permease subunit